MYCELSLWEVGDGCSSHHTPQQVVLHARFPSRQIVCVLCDIFFSSSHLPISLFLLSLFSLSPFSSHHTPHHVLLHESFPSRRLVCKFCNISLSLDPSFSLSLSLSLSPFFPISRGVMRSAASSYAAMHMVAGSRHVFVTA